MPTHRSKPDREGKYIYLGAWDFGPQVVGLLAEIGTGNGSFCHSFAKAKGAPVAHHTKVEGQSYITIGVDQHKWRFVLGVLMHEAMECAFTEGGLRYSPAPQWSNSHANYLFTMNHEQFSEATERAALWLTFGQSAMHKAWKRFKYTK